MDAERKAELRKQANEPDLFGWRMKNRDVVLELLDALDEQEIFWREKYKEALSMPTEQIVNGRIIYPRDIARKAL
jgi:hypothetical protein